MPKNRDFLFLVIRQTKNETLVCPIAVFNSLEKAEEYAGQCTQEFEDKNIQFHEFLVKPVIYYNE